MMKIATAGPPSRALPDPQALIKEARRRQRRRYAVAGAAVAVVLGSAAGLLAGAHGPGGGRGGPGQRARPGHLEPPAAVRRGPALIPASTGTTVLMWPAGDPAFTAAGGPPAYLDDLSTGRLTQSGRVDISAGDFQPLLAHVGHWLVYVADGTSAIRDDLRGRARVLGRTPFFAPAADPDHVWLFRARNGMSGPIQARLVPVTGGPPRPPVTLPAGATLPAVRGTYAGLLLQVLRAGRSVSLALWNPGSEPRMLPHGPRGGISDGFDATARLVAYGARCTTRVTSPHAAHEPNAGYDTCRRMLILDVVTGKLVSFAAPPGTAGWVPDGFGLVSAISPDGQMIAAYAAPRPPGQGSVRLYLMSLGSHSGRPRAVPSSGARLFARTAWSANGRWLFYQGPGGRLWAYQVTSGKVRASGTPCCAYTVMTAMPSHPGRKARRG